MQYLIVWTTSGSQNLSALLMLRKDEATLLLSSIINAALFMGATRKQIATPGKNGKRKERTLKTSPEPGLY